MEKLAIVLLGICTVIQLYAYVPQIIKLIKTKSSDDLSLSSWVIWIVSYLCYLGYVLITDSDGGIVFLVGVELVFTVIITVLILVYRKR